MQIFVRGEGPAAVDYSRQCRSEGVKTVRRRSHCGGRPGRRIVGHAVEDVLKVDLGLGIGGLGIGRASSVRPMASPCPRDCTRRRTRNRRTPAALAIWARRVEPPVFISQQSPGQVAQRVVGKRCQVNYGIHSFKVHGLHLAQVRAHQGQSAWGRGQSRNPGSSPCQDRSPWPASSK